MQRIQLGDVVGDGPELKPLQRNKYWSLGGCGRVNLRQELDANKIDFVSTIETCKPWEELKLPIVCKLCGPSKAGQPYLSQVHFSFQHCLQCSDVFVCKDCASTGAFADLKTSHKGHKFIQITTRPLSAPIYDGSDLEQLMKFRASETADEFFLYFPWFFHCFRGMDEVRNVNREQAIEVLMASPSKGTRLWRDLRDRQDYPVDWYIRTFGQGNWQSLLASMGPLLDAKIDCAKASIEINKLLLKLRGFNREKEVVYGKSDIPALPEAAPWGSNALRLAPSMSEYMAYTFPMQFTTILDSRIHHETLERLLQGRREQSPLRVMARLGEFAETSESGLEDFHRLFINQEANVRSPSSANSFRSPLSANAPLLCRDTSSDPERERERLWPMFSIIFKDHPSYEDLVAPSMLRDLSSFLGRIKPSWQSFLSKDHLVREALWQMDYNNLPEMTKSNLDALTSANPSPWPTDHPNKLILHHAEIQRRRGDFDGAVFTIKSELSIELNDVFVILELQRIYFDQGYLQRVINCSSGVIELPASDETPIAHTLLLLTANYCQCFVTGNWDKALTFAVEMFDKYLINWDAAGEDVSLLVYLEIYYHKTVLAASRDIETEVNRDAALIRLRTIFEHLYELPNISGLAYLAWDVLSTALEILKRPVRDQYFDIEDAFSVAKYAHTASIVVPMITTFLQSRLMVDSKHHAPGVLADLMMLHAEICSDLNQTQMCFKLISAVNAIFQRLEPLHGISHAGTLDLQILIIKVAGREIPFSNVQTLYTNLRQRNDIRRMTLLRRCNFAFGEEASPEYQWGLYQRASLRDLAKEAGDHLMFERWNLRKYAADRLSVSSIDAAEKVISNHQTVNIHSSFLVVLASFNLSRAYLSVGNFFEAALNALLHLSLTAQRVDVESHQRAMLNVLHIYSEAVANRKEDPETVLEDLVPYWSGWLTPRSYDRWKAGQSRCDEIDRFIDAALFIPNLAGRVGRARDGASEMIPRKYDSALVTCTISHLRLAFSLYEALPTYLAHTVLPKLAFALAAVATYVCNEELSIRILSVGQTATHSQDLLSLATFRLRAGKQMTLLGEEDPEHWLHVVPAGRALLFDAADKLLDLTHLAGTQMIMCDANVSLLRSLVAEARARKILLVENWERPDGTIYDFNIDVYTEIVTVINLTDLIVGPMTRTEVTILKIAQRLSMASPYEASRNLAFLASNLLPRQNRELMLEYAYIISDLEILQGRERGNSLWCFIQRFKSNVLYQRSYSQLLPLRYLSAIESDPSALALYEKEQVLVKEGPQTMFDTRLEHLQNKMMLHPSLEPLMNHRHRPSGVTKADFNSLSKVAKLTHGDTIDLILIDWMKYHDYFLMTGYNVSKRNICMIEEISKCSVKDVNNWVTEHLNVDGKLLPETLKSSAVFKSLYPLVSAIHVSCKKGDLLVFSPSQELHSIPLHALPYANEDDKPIIDFHPIVYTPSNIILKECILRVLENNYPPTTTSLFGRWGAENIDGAKEEQNIKNSLQSISQQLLPIGITSSIISGSNLTHSAFSKNMSQADILHFHTHVNETGVKQHLSLEPEAPTSNTITSSSQMQAPTRNGTYGLQDAFATQIQASLVVMMACSSGQQHISQSDDAMGLVSAFFSAGATSIVGTLWQFETSDASQFSDHFYRETFVKQKEKNLIDLAGAFQRSVLEMRACQFGICKKRRTLEERMECHVEEKQERPYNWASFVLWGSWALRGSGGEVKISEEEKAGILAGWDGEDEKVEVVAEDGVERREEGTIVTNADEEHDGAEAVNENDQYNLQ